MAIADTQPIDVQYINNLLAINTYGEWQHDRTSVGQSKQLFGTHLRFNTDNQYAPFIQHRTFAPRIAFEEWQWFMSGSTDVSILQSKNIHIWDDNSTREFLDSQGLYTTPTNTIGKAYGYQFRSFGGAADQVEQLFNQLKKNPTSRRHVVSIWNPNDTSEMALTPCAHLYEFMFNNGTLNLMVNMRSSDYVFGIPYNLGTAFFWLFTFSRALGYEMGEILINSTNAHFYKNQLPLAEAIWQSFCGYEFDIPTVELTKDISSLDDILNLKFTDFEIQNWVRGGKLVDFEIDMAV
jgi:thymidylate synthase